MTPVLTLPPELAPWAALALLAGTFALFVRETLPPELVAISALAAALGLGLVSPDQAFAAMANPAPATIACMFVLSAALGRVGALEALSGALSRNATTRPRATMAVLALVVMTASAFMNNTPVALLMIPIVIRFAETTAISPSRLLIPLSYCTILGGAATLIGASTNLIIAGVARQSGLAPFSLFEITPLGVALALLGLVYMGVFGPILLPDRRKPARADGATRRLSFMTEAAIPETSEILGRLLREVEIFQRPGMTVIDVLRGDESLRRALQEVRLQEGDRVILRSGVHELIDLRHSHGLKTVDRLSQRNVVTAEALVGPGCAWIGRSVGRLRLRRRYGVYPLAAHRVDPIRAAPLEEVVIRMGDTLLLEGDPDDLDRLADEAGLVLLSRHAASPFRRERAPVAIGVVALVIGLAAAGAAPIATLALLGACAVMLTGCVSAEEAYAAVSGRLLALILAMLGLGAALQNSGALDLIVSAVTPHLQGAPPVLALWLLILATSVLTEMITNNAVAIVMTPIAIALAQSLGLDPRPFVIGVMVGASASFATPIGYQTNTLVYAPGGYRFSDYLRFGGPLNLLIGGAAALLIPYLWSF